MSDVHFEHDANRTGEGSHFSKLPLRMAVVTALAPDNGTIVTGIRTGDELIFIGHIGINAAGDALDTEGNVADEFTISDDDEIKQESGGTTLTDDLLLVVWNQKHPNG